MKAREGACRGCKKRQRKARTQRMTVSDVPHLHTFADPLDERATYLYQGLCPISGATLRLPRTRTSELLVKQVAHKTDLAEGKMLGVLLVRDARGKVGYGRAFSGQMEGRSEIDGWVPPLHLPTPTASEAFTLESLADWKNRLTDLQNQIQQHPYGALEKRWGVQEEQLRESLRQAKQQRAVIRNEGEIESRLLEQQGRADSMRWRDFLRQKKAALTQGQAEVAELQRALADGKASRKALSKNLQAEMHEQMAESVTSFLGCAPERLFPDGIPTGTGDCCAPKLLAWAARHDLTPLAMAEVWWGPTSVGDKAAGEFYPACQERCQALLGPLLSLALRPPIQVQHSDEQIVVAIKPSGLLTVPGRYHWNQDSLLTRLSQRWPELLSVHRLDLETTGLVVFARTSQTQSELRRQWEEQTVEKRYEAVLDTLPKQTQGRIELPLGSDPTKAGCYRVDPAGKPSITEYTQLDGALVELRPITGRSHQLRIHMAQGLGIAIRGDRLYGSAHLETLKLHCHQLRFQHPSTGELLTFQSPSNFERRP